MDFEEHELKLLAWAISFAKNSLVAEQERDEPKLSGEDSTKLVWRLHELEEKLIDYYKGKKSKEGDPANAEPT